jgi:hypothetical protein
MKRHEQILKNYDFDAIASQYNNMLERGTSRSINTTSRERTSESGGTSSFAAQRDGPSHSLIDDFKAQENIPPYDQISKTSDRSSEVRPLNLHPVVLADNCDSIIGATSMERSH